MVYGDLRHQCWLKVVATYYLINDTGDGNVGNRPQLPNSPPLPKCRLV